MFDLSKPNLWNPFLRRFWKPVAVTGASGTAIAIWFEELLVFASDLIGLILLPILTSILYIFNYFLFKTYKN